jgi:hypothetical protein
MAIEPLSERGYTADIAGGGARSDT